MSKGGGASGVVERLSGDVHLTESVYAVVSRSQFPHKSVNLSVIITSMKNLLSDLFGN